MGAGQSATNAQTGVQGQLGQNQATNLYNAGAARASGYVGSANALGNALGSIGNSAMQYAFNNNPAGGGINQSTSVTMPSYASSVYNNMMANTGAGTNYTQWGN